MKQPGGFRARSFGAGANPPAVRPRDSRIGLQRGPEFPRRSNGVAAQALLGWRGRGPRSRWRGRHGGRATHPHEWRPSPATPGRHLLKVKPRARAARAPSARAACKSSGLSRPEATLQLENRVALALDASPQGFGIFSPGEDGGRARRLTRAHPLEHGVHFRFKWSDWFQSGRQRF